MHIRVDDSVLVIAGDDGGHCERVLTVDHAAGKLVVEGVNRVKKRPPQPAPAGRPALRRCRSSCPTFC